MSKQNQIELEKQIRECVGAAPAADFGAWEKKNATILGSLGKVRRSRSSVSLPTKGWVRWRTALAAGALIFLMAVGGWLAIPRQNAFAKTIDAINVARTLAWVRTSYERMTSKDGERHWLRARQSKATWMEPGFFRYDDFDEEGNLTRTSIDDPVRKQRLTLYYQFEKFELTDHVDHHAEKPEPAEAPKMKLAKLKVGPFNWFNRAVTEGGEIVGQRVVDGRKVKVLRWRNLAMGIHNPKNVSDVWIDAQTEAIVGTSHPGSSVFDPDTLEYRDNPPEKKWSRGTILGSITKDIVLDPVVDPAIFQFDIPKGYSKVPKRETLPVTETELVQWLEVLAKINDDQFVDGFIVRNTQKIAESSQSEEPSELEQQKRKMWLQHERNGNSSPLWDFVEANTVVGDHKYMGKGVKLGSANSPILIYRLKSTGKYRIVYGDLRIEEVSDEDADRIKGGL